MPMATSRLSLHRVYPTKIMEKASEATPLLLSSSSRNTDQLIITESITLKKTLSLGNATAIIISSMIGSGIFISPSGVTDNVGSAGASLIIWALAGLFNLILALCYAELGTAIPVSGGDYTYVQKILGPLPAFMCLWSSVAMAAGACALMSRTMTLYMFQLLNLDCHAWLLVAAGIWFHSSFSLLNSVSLTWSTRLLGMFSVAKVSAVSIIIITGLVKIAQGNVENLRDVFAGTKLDAGSLAVGFVPGFVASGGWESVNAMAGEMKNPKRDLPLSLCLSITFVTVVYLLTNLAYFVVLTPIEFVASDAVALSFAERALPGIRWIIPLAVATAAAGSMNVYYLMFPRYLYAGGKDGQLPVVFSYLSIWYSTPIAGVLLVFVLSVTLTAAIFFDVQDLIQILGVVVQIKQALALLALMHLKRTHPHLPRALSVPGIIVATSFVLLLVIITLSIYTKPVENISGCLFFLMGYPLWLVGRLGSNRPIVKRFMEIITQALQKALLVVP